MKKLLLLLTLSIGLNSYSQNYNPNRDKEMITDQGHTIENRTIKIKQGGEITIGNDILIERAQVQTERLDTYKLTKLRCLEEQTPEELTTGCNKQTHYLINMQI